MLDFISVLLATFLGAYLALHFFTLGAVEHLRRSARTKKETEQ